MVTGLWRVSLRRKQSPTDMTLIFGTFSWISLPDYLSGVEYPLLGLKVSSVQLLLFWGNFCFVCFLDWSLKNDSLHSTKEINRFSSTKIGMIYTVTIQNYILKLNPTIVFETENQRFWSSESELFSQVLYLEDSGVQPLTEVRSWTKDTVWTGYY